MRCCRENSSNGSQKKKEVKKDRQGLLQGSPKVRVSNAILSETNNPSIQEADVQGVVITELFSRLDLI